MNYLNYLQIPHKYLKNKTFYFQKYSIYHCIGNVINTGISTELDDLKIEQLGKDEIIFSKFVKRELKIPN